MEYIMCPNVLTRFRRGIVLRCHVCHKALVEGDPVISFGGHNDTLLKHVHQCCYDKLFVK
jgi:hypothetical protein